MLVKGNIYDERDMRGRKNLGERIRSKFHSVVYGKIPEDDAKQSEPQDKSEK